MSHSLNTWGLTTTFLFSGLPPILITGDKAWRGWKRGGGGKEEEECTLIRICSFFKHRAVCGVSAHTKQCYLRRCVLSRGSCPWMLRLGRAAHGAFGWLWLDRTQTGADWCLSERKCFGEEINTSYWRTRKEEAAVEVEKEEEVEMSHVLLWGRRKTCRHKDFSLLDLNSKQSRTILQSDIYISIYI